MKVFSHPVTSLFIALISSFMILGYGLHYISQKHAEYALAQARKDCIFKLDSALLVINSASPRLLTEKLREMKAKWEKDSTQNTTYFFSLSIDSLVNVPDLVRQQAPGTHYFQAPEDSLYKDAISVINPNKEKEGYTHQSMAQYDVLRRLFSKNWTDLMSYTRVRYDYSIFLNDTLSAPICSYVALDTTRRFLVQVSYKPGNHKLPVDVGAKLMYTKKMLLGIHWERALSSVFPFTLAVVFLWLMATIYSGIRQKRLNAALNNSPNAIAVINRDGKIVYTNTTFRLWYNQNTEGILIHDFSTNPRFKQFWDRLNNDIAAESPAPSISYWSKAGKKALQTDLSFDKQSRLIVSIDTDVSDMVNRWEGIQHSIKNQIIPLKDRLSWVFQYNYISDEGYPLIKRSLASIDEVALLVKNLSFSIFQKTHQEDAMTSLNLSELTNNLLAQTFNRTVLTYDVTIKNQLPSGCQVSGVEYILKLALENILYNAIQSCQRVQKQGYITINARLYDAMYWEVSVVDNGDPPGGTFEQLLRNSQGIGLSIIQSAVQQLGGRCIGFAMHDESLTKSFSFTLNKAVL
jgi:PAS domain-containing protein